MVGLGGLEPPTSPLSGARSSHLSYRPGKLRGNFYFSVQTQLWQFSSCAFVLRRLAILIPICTRH